MKPVALKWLDQPAKYNEGITFGVPFKEGEILSDIDLIIKDEFGNQPLQNWPLAFWSDGSVKWLGIAASNIKGRNISLEETVNSSQKEENSSLHIEEADNDICIRNKKMLITIGKNGSEIIKEIKMDQEVVCSGSKLIGMVVTQQQDETTTLIKEESFESIIEHVEIEQVGPLRCVIKIVGKHLIFNSKKQWLPFALRIIVFENTSKIKIQHNFIYDGDEQTEFIKGLGIQFKMPLKGPLYNRQLRFAGDTGMFSENCQFISMRTKNYHEIYNKQVDGELIQIPKGEDWIQDMAIWNHFKLVQKTSNSYEILKTTQKNCAFISCDKGNRSKGSLYIGDETKGLLIGLKDFWQRYPSTLEVNDLAKDETKAMVWFWSPEEEVMDLRHYDTITHTISSYEGAVELDSSPYGIGNTHDITIEGFTHTPSHKELFEKSENVSQPPLLICEPKRYYETKAIGVFSLPDESNSTKKGLEEILNQVIEFYIDEVEQRDWYGFWHYGDFMHTYDQIRHKWRYDLGGYAWQNTELAPNMWLWYMFLRSGNPKTFRLAEAMTRHTSEVDIYHLGPYKGLGSRHNVIHWGCGAKEARIAMAGLHRYYYYLTCDDRLGDVMDEVVDADYSTVNKDPMREYFPKDEYPTHARSGPDWAAFTSNWYTKWERSEDKKYLDKIKTGVESLYNMPYKMLSGSCFGYDPDNGRLHYMGENTYGFHLAICMGEPEVWFEIADQLADNHLKKMLIEFGKFYYLSQEEKIKQTTKEISDSWDWPMFAADIVAYAAKETKDSVLASKVWDILIEDQNKRCIDLPINIKEIRKVNLIKSIKEIPSVTTNTMSQWCLNVIVCLELIGEYLD